MLERRPFAAAHKAKKKAWDGAAAAAREAATRSTNLYVRNKGKYITRTNLINRIKLLRKAAKADQWDALRRSGSMEEYDERKQSMESLLEQMEEAEEQRALHRQEKQSTLLTKLANGQALQRTLLGAFRRVAALKKQGEANAAANGIKDQSRVKESTQRETKQQLFTRLDLCQESIRAANDALGSIEAPLDAALQQITNAVQSKDDRAAATEEKIGAMEKKIEGLEEQVAKTNAMLQQLFQHMGISHAREEPQSQAGPRLCVVFGR